LFGAQNSKPLTPVKKNIKEKSERLNKAKDGVEKKPTQREKLNKQLIIFRFPCVTPFLLKKSTPCKYRRIYKG
jgi:hypothetical protein